MGSSFSKVLQAPCVRTFARLVEGVPQIAAPTLARGPNSLPVTTAHGVWLEKHRLPHAWVLNCLHRTPATFLVEPTRLA